MLRKMQVHVQDAVAVLRGVSLVARSFIGRAAPSLHFAPSSLMKVQHDVISGARPSSAPSSDRSTSVAPVPKAARPSLRDRARAPRVQPSSPLELSSARQLQEKYVPASRIQRAVGFAGMAAGVVGSTLSSLVSSTSTEAPVAQRQSPGGPGTAVPSLLPARLQAALLSEENAERMAEELCRMRGAALKLAQMISIQDERQVPPVLAAALDRVRAAAHVMPTQQLESTMQGELGGAWRETFAEFDDKPFAAASIGQVHAGLLVDGRHTVSKVQYPGVADSIDSDIRNVTSLLTMTQALPRGLFLEHAIDTLREELAEECDFELEASKQESFTRMMAQANAIAPSAGQAGLQGFPDGTLFDLKLPAAPFKLEVAVPDLPLLHVPQVVSAASSRGVLTTTFAPGKAIDHVVHQPQHVRDAVGTALLASVMQQLFQFRSMQTDPNWGNYLYDDHSNVLTLIDFGALQSFDDTFVDSYRDLVWAAANGDRDAMLRTSTQLGFLTGHEDRATVEASLAAGLLVGEPFAAAPGFRDLPHGSIERYAPQFAFDFASCDMTLRVAEFAETMARGRLAPPPPQAYSLHRVLSGAFLTCMKLRARVPARALLEDLLHGTPSDRPDITSDVDPARPPQPKQPRE